MTRNAETRRYIKLWPYCHCSGHNPSRQAYDDVMREHLAMCFMCEELAAFPLSQSSCEVNGRLVETEELFCHCRMPYTKGLFMIECSRCLGWFHRSCSNNNNHNHNNNHNNNNNNNGNFLMNYLYDIYSYKSH